VENNSEYIIRYLEGNLPDEAKSAFERQINASPELKQEVESIAFIWRTSSEWKHCNHIDTKRNWDSLSRNIRRDKLKRNAFGLMRSAAAILLLPVLVFTVLLYNKVNRQDNAPIEFVKLTAPYGTVSKIVLSDGTEVWLNSGTALIYPRQFRTAYRKVHLYGEAYFKVKSNRSKPFDVILSDGLSVRAYGTEFNVTSYNEDNLTGITLINGNIRVNDAHNHIYRNVDAGQHIIYDKSKKRMAVAEANLDVITGWKEGKIIFRRTNMLEVAHRLSRHFNADIRLDDKELYDYEYSATFITETLPEILELLSKTAPLQYNITEPEKSADIPGKRIVTLKLKK
jgi:ferric-dicitrate binding protein FerR (iron transport regulator)